MRLTKRINASRKHLALSAPRHTTQERHTTQKRQNSGFDAALAATILTDAAVRAGAAIMRYDREGTKVELKADQSPVTQADKASETIVLEALHRLAPDVPVVSEEIATDRMAPLGPRFFLVDPLDGTKEFIQRRSDFTVNVALIENGRPSFGLVYAPARALLAVTVAKANAVSTELQPSAFGADFSQLRLSTLRARVPDSQGLTALVSLSHLDPETEAYLAKLN